MPILKKLNSLVSKPTGFVGLMTTTSWLILDKELKKKVNN